MSNTDYDASNSHIRRHDVARRLGISVDKLDSLVVAGEMPPMAGVSAGTRGLPAYEVEALVASTRRGDPPEVRRKLTAMMVQRREAAARKAFEAAGIDAAELGISPGGAS